MKRAVIVLLSAIFIYSDAPSLLMGYVVPTIITNIGISDSLIITVVCRNMLGSPMFVRNPHHTCHSILPRGTLHVHSAITSV